METFRAQKAWAFEHDKSMFQYYREKTDDETRSEKKIEFSENVIQISYDAFKNYKANKSK